MEEISNYMRRKNKKAELKRAKYAAATLYTSIFTLIFLVVTAPAIASATKGLDIHFTSVDTHIDNTEWQYPNETIEQKIVRYANEYGVNPERALAIGKCESSLNPKATNWQGSTASGVFMWTKPTWEYIGSPGDRFNADDNIKAFMEWYPTHSSWWQCDKLTK